MTRFATQFKRYAARDLVRQFGESLIYYDGGSGAGRSVTGIVERDVQTITDENIPALSTFVTLRDDATAGVASTGIDTGTDTIAVPLRVGETAQVRQVVRVESTENGLVRFEVN